MTEQPSRPDDQPRIVVGVDGSEQSAVALRHAVRLADALHARVEAVAAWHAPTNVGWGSLPDDFRPDQDAAACVEQVLQAVLGAERPASVTTRVVEGQPAAVLIGCSRDAQMLVVGSRGRGGFRGLLLGSVSSACAEHAACPVLVVHGADR